MTKQEFIEIVSRPQCRLHGKGRKVAELVYVEGMNPSDAARQVGVFPQSACNMLKKFRRLL